MLEGSMVALLVALLVALIKARVNLDDGSVPW